MSFQTNVHYSWAPGVEGDFASTNPSANCVAFPNGLRAGDAGVVAGRFAWIDPNDQSVSNKQPDGATLPSGFVKRSMTAVIQNYSDDATMTYAPNLPIALFKSGDFFARSSNGGTRGLKVFASITDGTILCDKAGAQQKNYVETNWYCENGAGANELITITSYPVY